MASLHQVLKAGSKPRIVSHCTGGVSKSCLRFSPKTLIADSSDRLFLSLLNSLSKEGKSNLESQSSMASCKYTTELFASFGIKY